MTNGYHPEKGTDKPASKPSKAAKKTAGDKKPPAKTKGKRNP